MPTDRIASDAYAVRYPATPRIRQSYEKGDVRILPCGIPGVVEVWGNDAEHALMMKRTIQDTVEQIIHTNKITMEMWTAPRPKVSTKS